jgi:hypothetical protein
LTIFGIFGQFSAFLDNFRRFLTIFGDFWQFSAKKLTFLSKNNVMIKILNNLALFRVKMPIFFAEFYGKNIFKNHIIGPRLECISQGGRNPLAWK